MLEARSRRSARCASALTRAGSGKERSRREARGWRARHLRRLSSLSATRAWREKSGFSSPHFIQEPPREEEPGQRPGALPDPGVGMAEGEAEGELHAGARHHEADSQEVVDRVAG